MIDGRRLFEGRILWLPKGSVMQGIGYVETTKRGRSVTVEKVVDSTKGPVVWFRNGKFRVSTVDWQWDRASIRDLEDSTDNDS